MYAALWLGLINFSFAAEMDRVGQVHVDKVCGPVPWEAFQWQQVQKKDSNAQDLNGQLKTDGKELEAGVGLKNNSFTDVDGTTTSLPINGDQWVTMYLIYMECVSERDAGKTVDSMWKRAMKGEIVKSMADLTTFMNSAPTLRHSNSNEWWKQTKEMMATEFKAQNDKLAAETARLDALYAVVGELRTDNTALKARVTDLTSQLTTLEGKIIGLEGTTDSLVKELAVLKALTDGQNAMTKKEVKELDDRVATIEGILLKSKTDAVVESDPLVTEVPDAIATP